MKLVVLNTVQDITNHLKYLCQPFPLNAKKKRKNIQSKHQT